MTMKNSIRAAACTALLIGALLPASALANEGDPQNCEANPQQPFCGGEGDSIQIVQPTAQECPNGGLVVVFNDIRYPICNGKDGQDGQDGAAGTAGPAGPSGATGNTGPTGAAGATGTTGANGTAGTNGVDGARGADGTAGVVQQALKCVSKRRFSIKLRIKALRHAKTVRVKVAGKTHSMHPNKNGRVWIDLRGLKPGVYGVVARNGGGEDARIYTVCSAGNVSNVTVGAVH